MIFHFPIVAVGGFVGLLVEQSVRRRIARTLRTDAAGREEVEDLVAGDREEPAAEGPLVAIVVESGDRRRDGPEHVLHQVGGVGVLQAAFASEAVHDGAVHPRELLPGGLVRAVAQLDQQASSGQR